MHELLDRVDIEPSSPPSSSPAAPHLPGPAHRAGGELAPRSACRRSETCSWLRGSTSPASSLSRVSLDPSSPRRPVDEVASTCRVPRVGGQQWRLRPAWCPVLPLDRGQPGRDLRRGSWSACRVAPGPRLRGQLGPGRDRRAGDRVVAGAVAAIFGGSRVQVSGPTGAMTVVLVPIIATHGPGGVLVVGPDGRRDPHRAGLRRSRPVHPLRPRPRRRGLHVGIAASSCLQQVPAALAWRAWGEGAGPGSGAGDLARRPRLAPLVVAAAVVALVLVLARAVPRLPGSLLAVVARHRCHSLFGLGRWPPSATIPRGLPRPVAADHRRWPTSTRSCCPPSPWPPSPRWRACCRPPSPTP